MSCSKNSASDPVDPTDQGAQGQDQNPAPAPAPTPTPTPVPEIEGCVQVFYDRPDDTSKLGRTYALMIVNLLGHFPKYQSIVGPIELYRKGDLDRCEATFYIGMARSTDLPADFLQEYKTSNRQVVWLGYNFWQLGEDFEKTFGFKSFELATLDKINLSTDDGKPSFFRDILYKGETFKKFNEWTDETHTQFDGSFELVKLSSKTSAAGKVLAAARHSASGEIIPWVLQNGNKFYITEVPLSYFHEADRYFVFADLLFDFLKEKPRHDSKNAYLRLEDIGPIADLGYLQEAMDILKKYGATPHINLYPVFMDPLDSTNMGNAIRMENAPAFFNAIKKYQAEGTSFIWHGITHQYSNFKNPYSGASGDDYEFWNSVSNSPLAEDSVNYVLDLLENGFNSFKLIGLSPKIWVTPHYHGSALDNVMFGQMFPWMVSRAVYIDNKISGLPPQDLQKSIYWDAAHLEETAKNRRKFFADLKVETPPGAQNFGQIFPYEIYGDIFRQRIIPENLGNVVPAQSAQVKFPRSVDNMLADAKRNLVLRDVWAAMFYHPFLLNPAQNPVNAGGGAKDLEKLVSGLKDLGYKFISLDDYAAKHREKLNKPRIELEDIR